jgi:hypothetical protein
MEESGGVPIPSPRISTLSPEALTLHGGKLSDPEHRRDSLRYVDGIHHLQV